MPLRADERKTLIDYLTTNSDAWRQPGDRDILGSFTDEKLAHLKAQAEKDKQAVAVANAAVNGHMDEETGIGFRINPETGHWEKGRVANRRDSSPGKVTPGPDPLADAEGMDPDAVARKNQKRIAGKGTNPGDTYNTEPEPTPSRRRPQTFDEVVRNSSPEVQRRLQKLAAIEEQQKDTLISQLVMNVSDAERAAQAEWLHGKELEDLQRMVALLPRVPANEEPAPTGNSRRNRQKPAPDEDMLGLPRMDWQSVDGQAEVKQPEQRQVRNTEGDTPEPTEDEWLRLAPAGLRQRIHNALATEEVEKNRIIDELVANFQGDDEGERRFIQRLKRMDLETLRDLSASRPGKQQPRTNYFGAAAAPLGNNRPEVDRDDILLPPQMNWKEVAETNGHR